MLCPTITIPIDAGAIRIVDHVAAIARGWRRRCRRLDLLDTPGIGAERPALVAVPEANHQLHQQIAVDQMTFPGPLLRKFGRRTAEIDIDDFVERLVPIELDRLLVLEARRRLLGRGLGEGRRRTERRCNAGGACRRRDEVTPIDLILVVHQRLPIQAAAHGNCSVPRFLSQLMNEMGRRRSPLLRLSVPSMRNARSAIFQPDPVPHERLGGLIARAFFCPAVQSLYARTYSARIASSALRQSSSELKIRSVSTGIVPKTTTMSVHFMGAPERVLRSSRLNRALLRPLEPDQWLASCRREILRRPRVIEDAAHRVFSREFGTARYSGWWVFAPLALLAVRPGGIFAFFVVELDERAVVMVSDGRNEPAGVCSRSGNGGGSFGRIVLACPPFAIFRWRLCPNGHQRDCRVSHEAQQFNSRLDREPAGHGRCKRRHTRLLRRPSQIPRCKSDVALLVGRRDRIQ